MRSQSLDKMKPKGDYKNIESGIIDSHAHLVAEYWLEDQDEATSEKGAKPTTQVAEYCQNDQGDASSETGTKPATQAEIIQRSLDYNVKQIINPAVELTSLPELINLSEKYQHIYIGAGLHPHSAESWTKDSSSELKAAAQNPKVVAIGECGLDFHYNRASHSAQIHTFKCQVKIAQELNKPLIIHCRNAFSEMKEILDAEGNSIRGVLHCFTGSPAIVSMFQDLDFYFSFSGIVTFPNAKEIQAAAAIVPANRLLVETDCPFLAPQPVRGKKNEPAYVWLVAEKLAELRSTTLAEIAKTCSQNTRALFSLPES